MIFQGWPDARREKGNPPQVIMLVLQIVSIT
jgi:hypothetical protein